MLLYILRNPRVPVLPQIIIHRNFLMAFRSSKDVIVGPSTTKAVK